MLAVSLAALTSARPAQPPDRRRRRDASRQLHRSRRRGATGTATHRHGELGSTATSVSSQATGNSFEFENFGPGEGFSGTANASGSGTASAGLLKGEVEASASIDPTLWRGFHVGRAKSTRDRLRGLQNRVWGIVSSRAHLPACAPVRGISRLALTPCARDGDGARAQLSSGQRAVSRPC